MSARNRPPRERRPVPPLTKSSLYDLATRYVARYATTSAKLRTYLARKLRERGWDGESPPDVEGIAERFVELGYIDDEAYARAKSGSLLRRGYGKRRISQTLHHDGIDEPLRESVAPSDLEARQAVVALAKKRRFGPFATQEVDRDRREKQIAALLRAGHSFDHVRAVMACEGEAAALAWVDEGEM